MATMGNLSLPLRLPLPSSSSSSKKNTARARSCKSQRTPVAGKRMQASTWLGRFVRPQSVANKMQAAKGSPPAARTPGSSCRSTRSSRGGARAQRGVLHHPCSPTEAVVSFGTSIVARKRLGIRSKLARAVGYWRPESGHLQDVQGEQLQKQLSLETDDDVSTTCSTTTLSREHSDVEETVTSYCEAPAGLATLSKEELRLRLRQDSSSAWSGEERVRLWPKWFIDEAAPASTEEAVSVEAATAIELDVPRTCSSLSGDDLALLGRVLNGFAARRPEIGYCQGLNFMAATFVMLGFDEEYTLRGLCTIVDGLCPGYHGKHLEGYRRDSLVLKALVRRALPSDLVSFVERDLGVPLDVLAMDHFLTLGAASWPLEARARLWDVLIAEGQPALFASFLALLNICLPSIRAMMSCKEFDGMPGKAFKDAVVAAVCKDMDGVLRQTYVFLRELDQTAIENYRFIYEGC